MATIASRTVSPASVGFSSLDSASSGSGVSSLVAAVRLAFPSIESAAGPAAPNLSTTLRCTIPPIFAATDNLRQFYRGGAVPQFRFLPAPPIV